MLRLLLLTAAIYDDRLKQFAAVSAEQIRSAYCGSKFEQRIQREKAMWEDIFRLLICVAVGSVTGIVLLRTAPQACVRFAAWSRSPKRAGLYVVGFVAFSGVAAVNFFDGNKVYSVVGVALAILELAALAVVRRPSDVMRS